MTAADAGPLIALARIAQLDLLQKIVTEIVIPEAVFDEIVRRRQGRPGEHGICEMKKNRISDPVRVLDGLDLESLNELEMAAVLGEERQIMAERGCRNQNIQVSNILVATHLA